MQRALTLLRDQIGAHRTLNQLVLFGLVGLLNTAFGMGVFSLLVLASVSNGWAVFWATVLGVLFNFQTTGRIVFGSRDLRLIGRFVLMYGLVYAVNLALLEGLVRLGLTPIPAQALILPAIVVASFALQKGFVFRR